MKKWLGSLALSLSLLASRPAQAKDPLFADNNNIEDHALVALANTGFGALVGCIGAEISGDGCLEGGARGALGGMITYTGMEIGANNADVPFTGLIGRGVVNLGASIIDNAAYSRGFLERYEADLGPLLLSFDSKKGVDAYVMPFSAFGVAYYAALGHRLDIPSSIFDGTFVFTSDSMGSLLDSSSMSKLGAVSGNSVSNIPTYASNEVWARSHENIHSYQMARFRWVDGLLPKLWRFRYGSELVNGAMILPLNIMPSTYSSNPAEIEAYTLQDNIR